MEDLQFIDGEVTLAMDDGRDTDEDRRATGNELEGSWRGGGSFRGEYSSSERPFATGQCRKRKVRTRVAL